MSLGLCEFLAKFGNLFYLQLFFLLFLQIYASLVYWSQILCASSQYLRPISKRIHLFGSLLLPFFSQPEVSLIDSFLRLHEKVFKGRWEGLIIEILVNFMILLFAIFDFGLVNLVYLHVLLFKFFLFLLCGLGAVNWLVLLIEDLIKQLFCLLFDGKLLE